MILNVASHIYLQNFFLQTPYCVENIYKVFLQHELKNVVSQDVSEKIFVLKHDIDEVFLHYDKT